MRFKYDNEISKIVYVWVLGPALVLVQVLVVDQVGVLVWVVFRLKNKEDNQ